MGKKKVSVENFPVSTRVPKAVYGEIEKIIEEGNYLDISDYLRDVIRKDLESRRTEEGGKSRENKGNS